MNKEKIEENLLDFKLLSKKRAKSKVNLRHKNKKKNKHSKINKKKKKSKEIIPIEIKTQKNIELVKGNYRHFFHINWDDPIFSKESKIIGESIDGLIYWFLINTSYFIEENIQDYVQIIKEKYFQSKDINKLNFLNEINNNNLSLDIYNNNESDIKNIRIIRSIMDFIDYDKKGNYFPNVFGYNSAKSNLNIFRDKLKNYINTIHQINQNKINNLEKKAKIVQDEFNKNNNNNYNDKFIRWINENLIEPKNNLSYTIHNKYLNYLFDTEKKNLLKQDYNYNNIENEENFNKCYVCNNGDINQYPNYFECSQCGIKVHQYCYGIKLKFEPKNWKCEICKEMSFGKAIDLECILCPNKGGAMKKINLPKNSEIYRNLINLRNNSYNKTELNNIIIIPENSFKSLDCAWVHLSCALWNKDIKFGNSDSKSNISLIDQNIYYKYISFCHICNKNNYGPTIKCNIDNCNFQCHPECGRINNNFLEVEIEDKIPKYNIYCHKHHPNRFAKIVNNINEFKKESIFAFDDCLNRIFQLYKLKYKEDFYKRQKDEEFILMEDPIKISEDKDNEEDINCNKNVFFSAKKISKIKKNSFQNISNIKFNQIKKNSKENISISEIKIKRKELNEIKINILNQIKNNSNDSFEEKNDINSIHNNNELPKNENNSFSLKTNNYSPNFLVTENTQSKSNSSVYIEINNVDNSYQKILYIKPFLSLEEEIDQNKESFIVYLIGFLNDYFINNRLILEKGDGYYSLLREDDDYNLINDMTYEELFDDEILPINEIKYKDLTTNLIKKYLKYIFPNENAFKELFINKIDSILDNLKKNKKYYNREILCKNKMQCVGSKNGEYKLLDVDQFKYQIWTDENIPVSFICNACLNYNDINQ